MGGALVEQCDGDRPAWVRALYADGLDTGVDEIR
jgi:hypothetical protein